MVSREIKCRVIHRYCDKYPIRKMCQFFEISKSTYYRWQNRLCKIDKDHEVASLLYKAFVKSKETYGYRCLGI